MKSATDRHWNQRAASVADDVEVNIMDIFQRNLEYEYVCRYLEKGMRVLEVGCGNGFSTKRFRELVEYVDAFDYAENMIARARAAFGETNNRFIHDDVLAPRSLQGPYDVVICVRVLINLRNLDEQRKAVANLLPLLRPGGRLILVEGFTEGFSQLTVLREKVGLPAIEPAAINFYSSTSDLLPHLEKQCDLVDTFHLGAYDYLTRVVYPMVAGHENVRHNSVFSERAWELAQAFNPDDFEPLSRIRGFVFQMRGRTQGS